MRKQGTIIRRRYYANKFGKDEWFLILTVKDKMTQVSIVGTSNYIPSEGDYVIAWGEFNDKGDFKATRITLMEPQEIPYIINRLRSFEVFEENEILNLVQKYGKKIWSLIEREEIPCSEPSRLQEQFRLWKYRSDKEEAEIELSKYFEELELPIEDSKSRGIVASLGTIAKTRILEEPQCLYQLLSSKFLSEYAKKINMNHIIKKELIFLAKFHEMTQEGKDLCLPEDLFSKKHIELMETLIQKGYMRKYQEFYYLVPPANSFIVNEMEEEAEVLKAVDYLTIERTSAQIIVDLLQNNQEIIFPKYTEIAEEHELSTEQTEALRMFMKNRFSLVFGGPGNGKTKMISAVVALAYAMGATFNLVAPTGRAAKRIRELMNEDSHTIHRFILDPNLVRGRFLIIDECSMIDSKLFYKILTLGGFERILMLGDINQLPPIAAGFPFLQLYNCEEIPRTVLTQNFRFDKNSEGIAVALKRIINGNPNLKQCGNGLTFLDTRKIKEPLLNKLRSYDDFDVDQFRVITPLRKLVKLHMENVRSMFIDANEEIIPGDWIICRKNLSKKNVYNGDIGQITSIEEVMVERDVKKDGKIEKIERKELHYFVNVDGNTVELESRGHFDLAYITTVHSSQGGETDNLILIMETDSRINTRQLLYTALSRAKKEAIVIAPKEVISSMIMRIEETRYSCLDLLIRDNYIKPDEFALALSDNH